MRQRIIERLKEASRLSEFDAARWRDLKERLGDIAISTIDAFCLSLLREFPLEADVDPGFDLADDTEVPRLVGESLDQALRICRGVARDDDDVALVFAQLGERRLRGGIAALLDRRLVAPQALRRFLQKGPRDLTAASACVAAAARLRRVFGGVRDGLDGFLARRPVAPSAVRDAGGRRARARAARVRLPGPRRAGRVPRADRSAARVFPDAGGPAARRPLRRHRLHRRALRQPGRVEAASRHGCHDRAAGRTRDPRLPPRPERRHVARRLADLRGGAASGISTRSRRTRCSISPACSSARSSC